MSKKSLRAGLLACAVLLTGVFGLGSGSAAPTARAAVTLTPCDISGKERSLGALHTSPRSRSRG